MKLLKRKDNLFRNILWHPWQKTTNGQLPLAGARAAKYGCGAE